MLAGADTLVQLGWSQILSDLARRCRTARGAARADALEFAADPDTARAHMDRISEARGLTEAGAALGFGGITSVDEALRRAQKGAALEPEELVAVAHSARGCDRLRRTLADQRERAPLLATLGEGIAELGQVFHPILEAFDDDGRLADHASDELGGLRQKAVRARAELDRRARQLVGDPRLAGALMDDYATQRDDRYVLPVRVEARGKVPGIVHGTSQSGQTVFVEPDILVELGNQVVLADSAVADEERRILALLSSYVAEDATALAAALEVAAVLDLVAAAADQAEALRAAVPRIEPGGGIDLKAARHPLMELGSRACVPNDIALAPGTALVISGPNAGGKTVALKTVGLAVLMARAGLHVAAEPGSQLPWIERLDSDIGDAQSLDKDLSSFSGHLVRVDAILQDAGPTTLVLLDELAAGTEPDQGAALAQAVLEALAARGALVLVTTHYERLKAAAASDARFTNASVGFDLERMAPTFRLHLGVPGSSGALLLARRLALDPEVVARAEVVLGARGAGVEELIASLTEERQRVVVERAELAGAREAAEAALRAAEAARESAEAREQKAREASHDDAVAELREVRRELHDLRVQVRKRKRQIDAEPGRPVRELEAQADAAAARIKAHAPGDAAGESAGAPPPLAALVPGAVVTVVPLGITGQVAAAAEGGRVAVQVGPLRTVAAVADVRLVKAAAAGSAAGTRAGPRGRLGGAAGRTEARRGGVGSPAERAEAPSRAGVRTRDATLDVRGDRVDEALAAVDRFVDQSLVAARDAVFVIHGHGTGALRNAVRAHLAAHAAVSEMRPGEPSEGGDGVTVAWLDV